MAKHETLHKLKKQIAESIFRIIMQLLSRVSDVLELSCWKLK